MLKKLFVQGLYADFKVNSEKGKSSLSVCRWRKNGHGMGVGLEQEKLLHLSETWLDYDNLWHGGSTPSILPLVCSGKARSLNINRLPGGLRQVASMMSCTVVGILVVHVELNVQCLMDLGCASKLRFYGHPSAFRGCWWWALQCGFSRQISSISSISSPNWPFPASREPISGVGKCGEWNGNPMKKLCCLWLGAVFAL